VFKTLAIGVSAFAALLTASPVHAAPASFSGPKDDMVIDVVTANGSGCPWGTADVSVSPDSKAFTVTYSAFTAQVGIGAKPIDFRKNCQLGLNVHVPQGFTYAIASTDYRGFAHLERGATAAQTSFYYFQGERQTSRSKHNFTGPIDGDWQRTDTLGIGSLAYLPCGEERYLNINTELRVNGGWSNTKKTTSMLTMDSTDGNLDTVYHVAWKKC
jgi:hypothetical protein